MLALLWVARLYILMKGRRAGSQSSLTFPNKSRMEQPSNSKQHSGFHPLIISCQPPQKKTGGNLCIYCIPTTILCCFINRLGNSSYHLNDVLFSKPEIFDTFIATQLGDVLLEAPVNDRSPLNKICFELVRLLYLLHKTEVKHAWHVTTPEPHSTGNLWGNIAPFVGTFTNSSKLKVFLYTLCPPKVLI